ncbi:hypothetical protein [Cetobacterium sp.]
MMKKNIIIKNFKSREEAENVKTVFEGIKGVISVSIDYPARIVTLKTTEDFSDPKIRNLFKENEFDFEIEKIE